MHLRWGGMRGAAPAFPEPCPGRGEARGPPPFPGSAALGIPPPASGPKTCQARAAVAGVTPPRDRGPPTPAPAPLAGGGNFPSSQHICAALGAGAKSAFGGGSRGSAPRHPFLPLPPMSIPSPPRSPPLPQRCHAETWHAHHTGDPLWIWGQDPPLPSPPPRGDFPFNPFLQLPPPPSPRRGVPGAAGPKPCVAGWPGPARCPRGRAGAAGVPGCGCEVQSPLTAPKNQLRAGGHVRDHPSLPAGSWHRGFSLRPCRCRSRERCRRG